MHARDPIELPNASDPSRDVRSVGVDDLARAGGRRF